MRRHRPSGPSPLAIGVLTALAASAAVATVALVAPSTVLETPALDAVVRALLVASWTLCGIWTWDRRPASRLGPAMLAVGLLAAATSLNGLSAPAAYTLGTLLWAPGILMIAYVVVAFPSGRPGPAARRVIRVASLASLVVWAALLAGAHALEAFGGPFRCAGDCPHNPFRVVQFSTGGTDALQGVAAAILGAVAVAVVIAGASQLRDATPAERRVLVPAALSLLAAAAAFGLGIVARIILGDDDPVARAVIWLAPAALASFPFALQLAQARGRLFAAGALRDTVSGLPAAPDRQGLESVMAEALGDPGLRLAYWVPEVGWVDDAGHRTAVPDEPGAVTIIRDGARVVAAVIHDPALEEPAALVVEAAGQAVLLALENARLDAEVRASALSVQESRARILTAAVQERRRLERDLHDVAQQRLVALRIRLSLAEDDASAALRPLLERLGDEVEAGIDGLRAVGRGLYPPLLADSGLAAALRALPRSHVEIALADVGRSRPEAEAAVYGSIRDAVAVLEEQGVPQARLAVRRDADELELDIAGGRTGGLPPAILLPLRDRIGALGGTVAVRDRGVTARLPWPEPA